MRKRKIRIDPRRAALWAGLFVIAFFGGSWLGRFVVAGVDVNGAPTGEAAVQHAAAPAFVHNGAGNAAAAPPAVRPVQAYGPSDHVCDGCDAGATRDRQRAQEMGLPVGDGSAGDGDAGRSSEDGDVVAVGR